MLVGLLGEKDHSDWWQSNFLSSTSDAFLQPAFPKSTFIAKYHGVVEAARRVHDDRVGTGRIFHLFRLPESLEQLCFDKLSDIGVSEGIKSSIESASSALAELKKYVVEEVQFHEGPIRIGGNSAFKKPTWIPKVASHYDAAFNTGRLCLPYFTDQECVQPPC